MSQFLVKVLAILGLTLFISIYFSVDFSVIFTRLILGLLSLNSDLRTLRAFKTFLLISQVNTQLNLTNSWLICTIYLG